LDKDQTEQLPYSEFCQLLHMQPSPTLERMFGLFGKQIEMEDVSRHLRRLIEDPCDNSDAEGKGTIDAREFLVGIAGFVDASPEDRIRCMYRFVV